MTVKEFVNQRWWNAWGDLWRVIGCYARDCNSPYHYGPHYLRATISMDFWPRYAKCVD